MLQIGLLHRLAEPTRVGQKAQYRDIICTGCLPRKNDVQEWSQRSQISLTKVPVVLKHYLTT